MIKITKDGIEVDRLDAIFDKLGNSFKEIYGGNINIAPDSPDGQILGIFSQALSDACQGLLYIRQQTDPEYATGAWLDQMVSFSGLKRRQAAHSYLRSAIILGKPYSKIDSNFKVKDKNNNVWNIVAKTQLNGNGSARADFKSNIAGIFNLDADETLTIETLVLGVDSVTTLNAAEIGSQIETDEQLRIRFKEAKAATAESSISSISTHLLKVKGVKKVVVLENYTGEVDANEIRPHTIDAIVYGGEDEDIARTIYKYKDGGCGLQGNTQVVINEDNDNRLISFDRPTNVDIKMQLQLERYRPYTEIDHKKIKEDLVGLSFNIHEKVYLSRLISTINETPGFSINNIKITRDSLPFAMKNIEIGIREMARFLPSDIEIEVI